MRFRVCIYSRREELLRGTMLSGNARTTVGNSSHDDSNINAIPVTRNQEEGTKQVAVISNLPLQQPMMQRRGSERSSGWKWLNRAVPGITGVIA